MGLGHGGSLRTRTASGGLSSLSRGLLRAASDAHDLFWLVAPRFLFRRRISAESLLKQRCEAGLRAPCVSIRRQAPSISKKLNYTFKSNRIELTAANLTVFDSV